MATHHAAAGEVVNLETWANDLKVEKSKVIIKTTGIEIQSLPDLKVEVLAAKPKAEGTSA